MADVVLRSRDLLVSPPSALGLRRHGTSSGLCMTSGDLNTGPHALY